jgi:hypothetical protein
MQNQKTISSIRDLFSLLESSGAILGRTEAHIVLDRQRMPGAADVGILNRYELRHEDTKSFAARTIFLDTSYDEHLLLLDVSGIEKPNRKDDASPPFRHVLLLDKLDKSNPASA